MVPSMTEIHSVIITCFNKIQSIETSIQSALAQDIDNIEVVVIDDCSTDASLEIIEKYRDNIKIIKNNKNIGVLLSTLKAIRESSGRFITLLDGDDFLCPGSIRCIHQFLQENQNSLFYTSSIRVNADDLNQTNIHLSENIIYKQFTGKEFIRENATGGNTFSFGKEKIMPLIDIFPPILIQDHIIPILLVKYVEYIYFSKAITHIALNWQDASHITQNFPQMHHDSIEVYWQRILFEIDHGGFWYRLVATLQFFRKVYCLDNIFGIRLRLKWIYFLKCVVSLKYVYKIKEEAMKNFRDKYPLKYYL